jgi:hypothetical protein
MGTAKKSSIETSIDDAIGSLETVADEIRVKIHLASMDANDTWSSKLEPRLFEARVHAREAKAASQAAIEDALKAFKEFAASL